jgi:hypothetical protein
MPVPCYAGAPFNRAERPGGGGTQIPPALLARADEVTESEQLLLHLLTAACGNLLQKSEIE